VLGTITPFSRFYMPKLQKNFLRNPTTGIKNEDSGDKETKKGLTWSSYEHNKKPRR
jgi:hypothetical protein